QFLIRKLARNFDRILLPAAFREEGRKIAAQAIPFVRQHAPDLYEETRGIADGAGLEMEEVFRLNCSSELYAWLGCKKQQVKNTVTDGCTSFAVKTGQETLVAWNMDWWRSWQEYLVLIHGIPEKGPRFLCVAMAGAIGRPGLSEKMGLAANYLPYQAEADCLPQETAWAGPGVPYNFVSRMLLVQESTRAAISLLKKIPRMTCLNYTLGDRQGEIVCVETLPREMAVIKPGEDFLVHANAYHSPKFHGYTEKQQEKHDPRAYLGRQLLRKSRRLTSAVIRQTQRAHFPGEKTGVCRHAFRGRDDCMTLLSFVAEVKRQRMWVASGPPCLHRFLPYRL
ncbi:MAG TPA: C45 family autoproteolytic acyltransferase/hydrolase, partial [bacterium]|nr:C45 family autoproteolytic acyltransferase/hydrolase [bacterium]